MLCLDEIFYLIDNNDQCNKNEELDIFSGDSAGKYKQTDIDFIDAYFSGGFDITLHGTLNKAVRDLFEFSFNAFDLILNSFLSELPVEKEITAFGRKITAIMNSDCRIEDKRFYAEKETQNRLDRDTLTLIKASAKVYRETDRLMGLLRFSPNNKGVFTAKCAPDHFILPILGGYFTSRFGETAWTVIDEKRNLCLSHNKGEKFKTRLLTENSAVMKNNMDYPTKFPVEHPTKFPAEHPAETDEWEELWKHYHKTINNEDRSNPGLQRQLMPERYWQYLPEIEK